MKMNESNSASGNSASGLKPRVLDGVAIAAEIKAEVAARGSASWRSGASSRGWRWSWWVSVAASEIYVRSKVKTCGELGIYSELLTPPESMTTDEMLNWLQS